MTFVEISIPCHGGVAMPLAGASVTMPSPRYAYPFVGAWRFSLVVVSRCRCCASKFLAVMRSAGGWVRDALSHLRGSCTCAGTVCPASCSLLVNCVATRTSILSHGITMTMFQKHEVSIFLQLSLYKCVSRRGGFAALQNLYE